MSDPHQDLIRKNARTGLIVVIAVLGMIALSFASVPLYDLFCRATGFGGTPREGGALPAEILDRSVTIKFNADTGRNMPWNFEPELLEIPVRLGERGLANYWAENRETHPVTGTAVYNVTPPKAGKYFHKIQCFCFDEQTLGPGEKISMPVMFYVDPALNDDPNMGDIRSITLSYTFYRAESKELDDALQSLYNSSDADIESISN